MPLKLYFMKCSEIKVSQCILAFRNFAKFTGKHRCQSLRPQPATLLKKRLWHRCFPVNFAKFLRTPFLTEQLRWLLLKKHFTVYSRLQKHLPTLQNLLQNSIRYSSWLSDIKEKVIKDSFGEKDFLTS